MKKLGLVLTAVTGAWSLGAGAHPGHDGVPVTDDNGIGYSLAHYLLSSEHLLLAVAAALVVGVAAWRPLNQAVRTIARRALRR